MKLTQPLHRFVAAVFSPFDAEGAIASDVVPIQAAFAAAQGIDTVFITGTTGECHSLTCDEKLTLYDAWARAARVHGLAVIAHVGGNSIEEAKTLARRARVLELGAISTLAPSFSSRRTLRRWSSGARRLRRRRRICRSTTTTSRRSPASWCRSSGSWSKRRIAFRISPA